MSLGAKVELSFPPTGLTWELRCPADEILDGGRLVRDEENGRPKELWESGEKALAAFAALLSAFVKVLPRLFLAGVVALVGLWFLNTADLSKVHLNWPWADSPR